MKILLLIIIPLLARSAPVDTEKNNQVSDDSLKPLIRTKRADEEILFGNHQNQARVVKKSDKSLTLKSDDQALENDDRHSDDVSTKPDDDSSANDVISDVSNAEADHAFGEDESSENNNENNLLLSETGAGDLDSSSGEEDDVLSYKDDLRLNSEKENFDSFYPYVSMTPYFRTKPKQKRGAPGNQVIAAEDRSAAEEEQEAGSNQRHKRDLTAEELYDWLENGQNEDVTDDDVEYYGDDENERRNDDDHDEQINELALELMAEEYPEEADANLDYPTYRDYGDEDKSDGADEMLSLIDYLEKGTPVLERAPLKDLYPEHIREEWDDLEMDPGQIYEPIVYRGVPGIFIPMPEESLSESSPIQKRQYLSMLPGQKKKRDFYPHHLEPIGGRWGAFVSPEKEKRDSDAYDRLYRLAEALNPRNRAYVDYK